jgi:UrcA family protein
MKKSLLAAVLVVFSASAYAEEFQVTLSYTAADFESVESVKALHRRIQALASKECPKYSETRDIRAARICADDIAEKLVHAVDNPALTAYLNGNDELRFALDSNARGPNAG